jgi:hypothetical protein
MTGALVDDTNRLLFTFLFFRVYMFRRLDATLLFPRDALPDTLAFIPLFASIVAMVSRTASKASSASFLALSG